MCCPAWAVNLVLTCASCMDRAFRFFLEGRIKPLYPRKVFPATQIQDAFRYVQKGQHLGKVVVAMPEQANELLTEAAAEELRLRPDRAYLFVGGLGGLGRSISTRLVERGAKHLVFMSRSAGNMPDDHPFVRELAALGCKTTRISGDVCKYDDVVRVIQTVGCPIAGVLQASMVLKVSSSQGSNLRMRELTWPSPTPGWQIPRHVLH